jgi:hypothetical protein
LFFYIHALYVSGFTLRANITVLGCASKVR